VRGVLVDAGPLVALLDRGDASHQRCVRAARRLPAPMLTVWPAFTEAMYLVRSAWPAQQALWEMLEAGSLVLLPLDRDDAPRMRELMRRYRDLPMDLADAALVRVAEREHLRRIFTLDRRDFEIYRLSGRTRCVVVPL
jgi:predicted nucleic acid-binding protein